MTPASVGKVPDSCASRRPGSRSVRSLGAITATSGRSRASTFGRLIAATMIPSASRSIQLSAPNTRSASAASTRDRNVGADRIGISGTVATITSGRSVSAARIESWAPSSARLATTATVCAWFVRSSAIPLSAAARTCSGVRSRPCTTKTTGDPRLAAILALKESSVPVDTSV